MSNLQDHHKKKFKEVNERLGLASEIEVLKSSISDVLVKKDTIVFGADELSSDIVGKVIPVGSIADLKKLSGIPYDADDSHVIYPDNFANKLSVEEGISESMKEEITKAATAYILGNPDKVKHYEDHINAVMFPGKALVFAAEDLYIRNGQTVVLGGSGDPEIYNFGTITIENGGSISVIGNVQLTCQIFTQL